MNTKQLKQKILSLAISGQLVPQDPTDEPASELLKRIAAEKTANVPKGKKQKITKDTSHYQQYPPFELPKGWVWCKLGEVFNNMVSTKPKTNPFKYIDINSIDNKKCKINEVKIINIEDAPSRATRHTETGDILFSMVRPYLRNIALVEEEDCIASTGFFICKPNLAMDSKYCYYLMTSDYVVMGLNAFMKGDNSPSINNSNITSFLFPLPPLAEQGRITQEVDRLFTLIDQLEEDKTALQQLVTQLKSKILNLAIRGQLVPQDVNETPAEELLKQINPEYKSSGNLHYKNLPKGWKVIPVKMVCKLKDGEKKENVKLPYLDVKYFRGKATSTIKENGKYIPKNTTLILVDGENSGEIFYASAEGYQGSTMKILEIEPIVDRAYILHFIKSYQKELKENKVGSAIPHLNKKLFGELQLPLPPFVEQQRIVERVEKLFKQLDAIQNALAI